MMARIYRPAPNAMQSGKAAPKDWLLEFESQTPRTVDPLMGWISNADTSSQVRMWFDTREEAIEFAKRQGIPFQVREPPRGKTRHQDLRGQFRLQPQKTLDALNCPGAGRRVTAGNAARVRPLAWHGR